MKDKSELLAAMSDATELLVAVGELARTLNDSLTSEALQHFTCRETNVVVTVLVRGGFVDEAVQALLGHASGDEDGDEHEELARFLNDGFEDAARELAHFYVGRL